MGYFKLLKKNQQQKFSSRCVFYINFDKVIVDKNNMFEYNTKYINLTSKSSLYKYYIGKWISKSLWKYQLQKERKVNVMNFL